MQNLDKIQDEIMQNVAVADELPAVDLLTQNEQANLGNINSSSKVSIFRKIVFVVSKAILTLQELWQIFRQEIEELIAASRPFTKRWYQETALQYQDGYQLNEWNVYPPPATAQEADALEASKIVKKAAVVQTVIAGVGALRLKVATMQNGALVPITGDQKAGVQEYMERKGAAGVFLEVTTGQPDSLRLEMKIYFDAMVLDNQGKRLDGTNDSPVKTAITEFLRTNNSRDFNGNLSLAKLVDVVQQVEGVVDPFVVSAASKFGAYNYTDTNQAGNVGEITDYRQPDAGYFALDTDNSTFNFIPA